MPRKTIIIISIIFSVIIIGLFAGAFFIARDEDVPVGDFLRDLFPFGQAPEGERRPPKREEEPEFPTPEVVDEEALPQLRQLTSVPVAGFRSLSDGSTTTVRYMERRTGHVFEFPLHKTGARRLTNTTIPGVRETIWSNDGNTVIARYLDEERTLKSFLGNINIATSTTNKDGEPQIGTLNGLFLEDNIESIVSGPEKEQYFVLDRFGNTSMTGTRIPFNEQGAAVRILDSRFVEWSASWNVPENVALFPRSSSQAPGYLYFLDTRTGQMQRVLGGVKGLTAKVSPGGDRVLYSVATQGDIETRLFHVTSGRDVRVVAKTLPEKCAWGADRLYCGVPTHLPVGKYPDDWYQGTILFSDRVEEFVADSGTLIGRHILSDIVEDDDDNLPIDITDPEVSENGRYFFFRNKRDGTLWALRLE